MSLVGHAMTCSTFLVQLQKSLKAFGIPCKMPRLAVLTGVVIAIPALVPSRAGLIKDNKITQEI
jgi:hypothetical protein